MPPPCCKTMADSTPNTSTQQASVSSGGASQANSVLGIQTNKTEDIKLLGFPKLEIERLKLPIASAGLEEEEEEEEDAAVGDEDDDDEEELSEELKQQMQQLTSIVNNAFKRADLQRNTVPSSSDALVGSSALDEVEFSSRKYGNQDLSCRSSIPGTRSESPHVTLVPSAGVSSLESQSTHTSDFNPMGVIEDGNQLLETLNNAPDSLEKALTLNQALQRRLTSNIERLEMTLKQNLHRQLTLHNEEDDERLTAEEEKNMRNSDSRYFLRISSFCRPYFKTKIFMPAPMNEDARFRIDNGYLDMYQTRSRPWSRKEDRQLQLAVQKEAREERARLLQQKENAIKRRMRNMVVEDASEDKEVASLASEAVQCQQQMQNLRATSLQYISVPPTLKLDWVRIAAQAFDGHRTHYECEHRWHALLSLNISQKNFSEQDDIAIQAAVRSLGRLKPDWEAIASQLSEPRSAFQVFRRYRAFISPALNPVKWDTAANQQLVQLVEHLRVGEYVPWSQVHQRMPGFTRTQLQSQWKKLNPGRRKGPFNRYEDSIFLRGILKFGLNFQQILQFMPQRNKEQLKDRFRRILVAVFMSEWTHEMDEELQSLSNMVERAHLNTSFWRRLAAVPGFANSGKDAAMLRLRYLILQLWREVSLSDEAPPPLFPVTITTSPEEIALVNKHFLNADIVEIREMIDKINAGNHIKAAMVELEKRRVRLHQQHDQHMPPFTPVDRPYVPLRLNHLHLHHMQQRSNKGFVQNRASDLHGRNIAARTPSVLSWPERLILEFFLPSKSTNARPADLSSDSSAVESLQLLMKVLQLRPMPPESCDAQTLEDLSITEAEVGLADVTVNQHTCKTGDHASTEQDLPCVWCSGDVVPETMPLLPPSTVTVGALQNLLVHRRTLRTMASKSFVLHRFKGPDLYQLGDKPRYGRSLSDPSKDYMEGRLPMPRQVGKIHITSVMPRLGLRTQWLRPKGLVRLGVHFRPMKEKKLWTKRSIIDIYKSYKSGKNLSQYQGPKKPSADVQNSGGAATATAEFRSSSGATASSTESPPGSLQSASAAAPAGKRGRAPGAEAGTSVNVKKRRGRPPIKPIPGRWAKDDAPSEPPEEAVTESSDSEDEFPVLTTEEYRARAEADNLLWHRFLAIFLWPAILSCVRPLRTQEQMVEQQYQIKCRDNDEGTADADDSSQRIAGIASSILQEVTPHVHRTKRKRSAADIEDDNDTETPSSSRAAKKDSPVPTRTSARLKKTRLTE